jgi:hypothetical protein
MRWTVEWTAAESTPDWNQVLRSQGLPEGEALPTRLVALVDGAFARYLTLAQPRAVLRVIDLDEFRAVYDGEGKNSHETPLEEIAPRADALALFVATVGERVSAEIADLFARREPALGYMLDAVASEAADALGLAAGEAFMARLKDAGRLSDSSRVLPYSPGYCGWHVSGQRKLFGVLQPEEIGVTLNASCLMQPLKSVSGVLVVGSGATHRFHPTYSFCERCGTRQCRDRMASVK